MAETLDGETTIVDLESGTYYALNESGSIVWDELGLGLEPEDIAARLAAHYEIDSKEAEGAVEALVSELISRKLIVPLLADSPDPPSRAASNGNPAAGNGNRDAYSPPLLSTFTDMQELLLLDPVHEVDESGWPSRPQV